MATRHRTQHMVGVVNWLMSGFPQPQTPGETPTDQSQKKKKRWLREKQKELHLCLSELGQGAGRHQTLRALAQAGPERESAHFQATWEAPTCLTASREDAGKGTAWLWRNRDTASQS